MELSLGIAYHLMIQPQDKNREMVLSKNKKLLNYLSEILENKKCQIYSLGIHGATLQILFSLNPDIALSKLVKDIKTSTETYIKENKFAQDFSGWEKGYWAYTHSIHSMDFLRDFIEKTDEYSEQTRMAREEHERYLMRKGIFPDDDLWYI